MRSARHAWRSARLPNSPVGRATSRTNITPKTIASRHAESPYAIASVSTRAQDEAADHRAGDAAHPAQDDDGQSFELDRAAHVERDAVVLQARQHAGGAAQRRTR